MSPRAIPDDWPRVYVEAKCQSCGEDLFAELYRPAVNERWRRITDFWLNVLENHRASCKSPEVGHSIPAAAPAGAPVSAASLPAGDVNRPTPNKTGRSPGGSGNLTGGPGKT